MSLDHLSIPVLMPGDFFAIQGTEGVSFYQAADGGIQVVGAGAPPAEMPAIILDGSDQPVTRDTEIEILRNGFSVRVYNVLKRSGFHTVGDILEKHEEVGLGYFYQLRNIGAKGGDEIAERVYEWGRAKL